MGDTGIMLHMQSLIDDTQCCETVRALRWPNGVWCPRGDSFEMTQQGRDDTPPERQRSLCQSCARRFDAVTDTLCAGHHHPLRVWILCLYCRGRNLSHHQIAHELELNKDAVPQMTRQVRQGIVHQQPAQTFTDVVEGDEVSSVAGQKGKPDAVIKKGGAAGADASRGHVAAGPAQRRTPRSAG